MYAHLSIGEMQTVRYSLLNFLQGHRVRVSVFLRQKVQNADGTFVIPTSGPVPPGNELHIDGFCNISLIWPNSENHTTHSLTKDKPQVICCALFMLIWLVLEHCMYTPHNLWISLQVVI